ncbi:MAG TPA: hypothetical protein VH643_03720 [Gemmataceae bacterium]|jgi:hypothetical protein
MGRKGLIRFRCWYCNRKHVAGWDQVGVKRVCNCGERYRVPRNPGIAWRDKNVLDRLLEFAIYGSGGAFLCGLPALMILRLVRTCSFEAILLVLAAVLCFGFLIGALFGERGINWIGSLFRDDSDWERDWVD